MSTAWGEITVEEILSPIAGICVSGQPHAVLAGLSTDSREIRPGELFWALKGEQYDGYDFALEAIEQGAAGLVVQKGCRPQISGTKDAVVIEVDDTLKALGDLAGWWRRQHNVRVVAITGSAGKTSTKEMAAGILELSNRTLKNQGNFNNLIGLPLTLLQLEQGFRNAVLEMGMNRPGEIARLTEIASPDVGVITNVGMAHLQGVGDIEGVARAKAELAEKISSKGKVAVNGDDELLLRTVSAFRKEMISFGLGERNRVRADRIQSCGLDGCSFNLHYQGESWTVRLSVPGLQNVFNALAAAAVAFCLHEPPEHIVEGLNAFVGVKGRFAVMSLPEHIILVDDTYNANPLSLKAALASIESLIEEEGRIIVGLGEMLELGDATVSAHREAGRMVAELRPHFFLAIGEHAHEMVKGAVESGLPLDRAEIIETHDQMLKKIRDEMRKGDLIFLKGSREVGLEKVVEGLKPTLEERTGREP